MNEDYDYLDPSNALNMPEMADMTFAMDFLIRVKEGVRNTAIALKAFSCRGLILVNPFCHLRVSNYHNPLYCGRQCTSLSSWRSILFVGQGRTFRKN